MAYDFFTIDLQYMNKIEMIQYKEDMVYEDIEEDRYNSREIYEISQKIQNDL